MLLLVVVSAPQETPYSEHILAKVSSVVYRSVGTNWSRKGLTRVLRPAERSGAKIQLIWLESFPRVPSRPSTQIKAHPAPNHLPCVWDWPGREPGCASSSYGSAGFASPPPCPWAQQKVSSRAAALSRHTADGKPVEPSEKRPRGTRVLKEASARCAHQKNCLNNQILSNICVPERLYPFIGRRSTSVSRSSWVLRLCSSGWALEKSPLIFFAGAHA